ncbi:site-2 protease family protein [Alkaliphilus peptidifermentans]|uniref:Zn-dependent protease (Includes SpoIVFB) n=1 Tax=Alkaliphilus peptidifermentans DSM 18978 TaxID=1120976 RepID=A0A1G5KEN5_9FIRM|nr:site-2 protease family protein [Alkaliphilus peptidifermentans]SCY99056.1 Zn-dependent protease (includes SpoIVFB) [Alkaliphilus peptidifermentans DSM 18978]
MFQFDINRIILTLPGILVALTLHEFAHAYTAYLLGDPTSKNHGRLTLNPIAHIDIFGFLMLMFAGFGWAKPVPINPNYFKNRKMGTFLVSIAGPATNIILAILFTFALGLQLKYFNNTVFTNIIFYGVMINIVLAVFNLLPIPPLDGSKLLLAFLPDRFEDYYYQYQKYSYFLLLLLLFFNGIGRVIGPIVEWVMDMLLRLLVVFF